MAKMEGRDGRRPGTFWIDNELVHVHAKDIGVHAFAVYMVLVCHSRDNECFPSTSTIAEQLGISRPTVSKAIHTLEDAGLIHIEERALPVRGQTSHMYTILQVTKTAVKEVYSGQDTAVKDIDRPCKSPLQGPVNDVYTNNTKTNKTNVTNDVAAALKSVGMTGNQRRAILEAQPELTPDEVAVWQSFRESPPPWCDKPEGYIYRRLLDGDAPPVERTNGSHTMTEEEKTARYMEEFNNTPVSHARYRGH